MATQWQENDISYQLKRFYPGMFQFGVILKVWLPEVVIYFITGNNKRTNTTLAGQWWGKRCHTANPDLVVMKSLGV